MSPIVGTVLNCLRAKYNINSKSLTLLTVVRRTYTISRKFLRCADDALQKETFQSHVIFTNLNVVFCGSPELLMVLDAWNSRVYLFEHHAIRR